MTRHLKVLVVEDETFLLKIYMARLKKEGFEVTVATDGEEAVRQAAETRPDIILLDILLPKMNGFEALERIRRQPGGSTLPVLVLSNLGQEEDIKRARDLGAVGYLVKADHSVQEIVAEIRKALA